MRGEIKKGAKSSSSGGVSRSKDKKALLSSDAAFYVPQSSDAVASPTPSAGGAKSAARARGRAAAADASSASDSDDDDNGAGSRTGSSSGAMKESVFDVTMLSEAVERLSDKRPSARQAALQSLLTMLRGAAAESTVQVLLESYMDSTSGAVGRILQRAASSVGAGVEETLLALEVLCLMGLIVGPQEDEFYSRFQPLLLRGLEADEEEVQCAALFSLCFLSFVCSDGHSSGAALMGLCESIICGEAGAAVGGDGGASWADGGHGNGSERGGGGGSGSSGASDSGGDDAARAGAHASAAAGTAALVLPSGVEVGDALTVQAVESWALLSVGTGDEELAERSQERLFEAFSGLLDRSHFPLKVAAGSALALLWAAARRLSLQPSRSPSSLPAPSGGGAGEAAAVSGLLCCDSRCVHAAITSIQQAARESSKHMKRKDKKEQRSAFREIAAFIVDGEAPEEGVRFTGVDYKASSFLQLRLLGDLRRVLGGCFERGLGVFPVVAEILGIDPTTIEEGERGGQVKKGGALEKQRGKYRDQDRRYKGGGEWEEEG